MTEEFVLIGAGSAMFTRGLVADLVRTGMTAEVALVDVDPAALDVATKLSAKMIAAAAAPLTPGRRSIGVKRYPVQPPSSAPSASAGGGRRAWEQDVSIARKYAISMPVGDTTGPSGSSCALRMIPAMVAIAQDVLDLALAALFFNYGNPMAVVCRAVHRATGAPIIGLCHGVLEVARDLANVLDVPLGSLGYSADGINHLTWFTEVRAYGHDARPLLRDIAAQRRARRGSAVAAPSTAYESLSAQGDDNPFSWHLFHLFDAFPAVFDRHIVEFFSQFFRDGACYGQTLGVGVISFERTIAYGDDIFAQMRADARAPGPLAPDYFDRLKGAHKQVIAIVDAIRNERGAVFSANLSNKGQVPNLPLDVIVEASAIADGAGVRAITQQPWGEGLRGTLVTRYMWAETIVDAALEGSRTTFIQALVLDGAVGSLEIATALADELVAAHAQYLPWVRSEPATVAG